MTFLNRLHGQAIDIKQPFTVKSFRFTVKDYLLTQDLMSILAKLFGYLFYKKKYEIDQESRAIYLSKAMKTVSAGIAQKVQDNFRRGFIEGVNENPLKDVKEK